MKLIFPYNYSLQLVHMTLFHQLWAGTVMKSSSLCFLLFISVVCGGLVGTPNRETSEIFKDNPHEDDIRKKPPVDYFEKEENSKPMITIETVKRVDITFDKETDHQDHTRLSSLGDEESPILREEKTYKKILNQDAPFSETFETRHKEHPTEVSSTSTSHIPKNINRPPIFKTQDKDISPRFKEGSTSIGTGTTSTGNGDEKLSNYKDSEGSSDLLSTSDGTHSTFDGSRDAEASTKSSNPADIDEDRNIVQGPKLACKEGEKRAADDTCKEEI